MEAILAEFDHELQFPEDRTADSSNVPPTTAR
jgi:hypothetical protein